MSDPMQVQPCHMVTYGQTGHGRPRSGMDHQQDRMGFPIDILFDFQHMYISYPAPSTPLTLSVTVSCNYWWPGISCYVASYIAGCNACNHCKSFPMQKVGKLTPNQIPTCCWRLSLLTPLENCWSLKDTMPSLW